MSQPVGLRPGGKKRRQRDKGKEGLVIELALRMSHFNRECVLLGPGHLSGSADSLLVKK